MNDTFVLRLAADALANGEVVGRVESVRTGIASPIRSLEELGAFLRGAQPEVEP